MRKVCCSGYAPVKVNNFILLKLANSIFVQSIIMLHQYNNGIPPTMVTCVLETVNKQFHNNSLKKSPVILQHHIVAMTITLFLDIYIT